MEAETAIALLEANGIQASGKFGDAGGWMPHIALVDGFRVLVFDDDLDAAKALLDAELTSSARSSPTPTGARSGPDQRSDRGYSTRGSERGVKIGMTMSSGRRRRRPSPTTSI